MKKDKFVKWVKEVIESLPKIFKEKLDNVEIIIEDEPPFSLSGSVCLLRLYQGVPLIKRGVYFRNILPDRIIIFRHSIERICSSEEEMKETVTKTLLHEIGHYFGLSEEQLKEIRN